jgi:predicted RND superfamily exporter protein
LFGLSAFPPVAQFGFLLAGTFVAALGAVLVLLPTGLLTRAD